MSTAAFRYSIRDLFAAPKLALAPKNIVIATFFLGCAYDVLMLTSYLAMLIDGEKLSVAISVYGIFPPILHGYTSIISTLIAYVGYLFAFLFGLHGVMGISLVTLEDLRGNPFFSINDAIKQSFARMPQLLGALFAVGFLTLLLVGVLALFGLIARIPGIGSWLWSLLLVVPNFILAVGLVAMVYLIGSVAVSSLPSIIAADKRKEIFGPVVELFSIVLRQPARWFSYTALALLLAKVASLVYAYVTVRAIELLSNTGAIVGGDSVAQAISGGMSHLPLTSRWMHALFSIYPGSEWSISIVRLLGRYSTDPVSYFSAGMLFILFLTIPGYFLSVFSVTIVRGYVIILNAKDNRRITEEPPQFAKSDETESAG